MHLSPSFSVTYSLIEMSEMEKSSGKIGDLVETEVSSPFVCNENWSSGAFSVRATCDARVGSLVVGFM